MHNCRIPVFSWMCFPKVHSSMGPTWGASNETFCRRLMVMPIRQCWLKSLDCWITYFIREIYWILGVCCTLFTKYPPCSGTESQRKDLRSINPSLRFAPLSPPTKYQRERSKQNHAKSRFNSIRKGDSTAEPSLCNVWRSNEPIWVFPKIGVPPNHPC